MRTGGPSPTAPGRQTNPPQQGRRTQRLPGRGMQGMKAQSARPAAFYGRADLHCKRLAARAGGLGPLLWLLPQPCWLFAPADVTQARGHAANIQQPSAPCGQCVLKEGALSERLAASAPYQAASVPAATYKHHHMTATANWVHSSTVIEPPMVAADKRAPLVTAQPSPMHSRAKSCD